MRRYISYIMGRNGRREQRVIRIRNIDDLANVPRTNEGYYDLRAANLAGANLRGANLRDADLEAANLRGTDLESANLRGANLKEANLEGANLKGADLEAANLTNANLINANLEDTNLEDAYLAGANLSGANLAVANIRFTNLRRANLARSNLDRTDFTNANLTGANMENVRNITRANLTDVNIDDIVGLTNEQIEVINFAQQPPTQPQQQGVAYEIHNKTSALLDNKKFLEIIGANIPPIYTTLNYNNIYNKMKLFITNSTDYNEEKKNTLINGLESAFNKAKNSSPTTIEINIINKAVEFAFNQDKHFIDAYINVFYDESIKAYTTGTDKMSCAKGIRERLYTSLLGAALIVDTISEYPITPEMIKLICIAKLGNLQVNTSDFLQEWAETWQGENKLNEWKQISEEKRKQNLIDFLIKKYENNECFETNKDEIINKINEQVNSYDYVFKDNKYAAAFGGNKRKRTKMTRKKKRNNKHSKHRLNKKCKTNKCIKYRK